MEQEKTQQLQRRLKNGAIDLTVGSPTKRILQYTLPLLAGNVFQLFYSWTDAIMLGNVKEDAVQFSALSASMPVINVLLTVVMGFLTGAAVVIGQLFGKGQYTALRRCYSTLLITMAVLSVVIGAIGFFAAEGLLRLINVSEVYLPYATTYLQFYCVGLIFMMAYNTLAQVLRCLGNSSMPLVALIVCVALNVLLDWFFVVGLDMNIEGVAIGTMIAQLVSTAIMFVYIHKKVPLLKIRKADFRFDKDLFVSIVKLGVPSTVQNVFICIGFMVINGIVNGNGKEFTTAFGVGNRIDEILTQINNSFGTAISGYAAQNKGKGEILRIKQGYARVMIVVLITVATLAGLIYVFKNDIFHVFVNVDVDNPDLDLNRVMEITEVFLSIYLPSFVILCLMSVTTSLIRGTGSAVLAMTVNVFSFVVRVTSAFVLDGVSDYGVFFASPIGWVAGASWALAIYFRGRWQHTDIFKEKTNDSQTQT